MLSSRTRSWILTIAAALVGVLALWWVNTAVSQGPVTSQLSYQGTLFEAGQPVTGTRDMVFRLYSDDLCATQVGPDIVRNGVAVEDGFFTVYLDVNQAVFDGQALWIQTSVGATTFACQPILPAPYALSLRPGAVIRGSTSSANGLVELDNTGPGQALRVTSTEGMVLYGTTGGGPAIYGYAGGGYGLRGVSSASGFAAVRGDTSSLNTLGGDFYSQESSGVSGVTASVKATPVPGVSNTYVAGVRGVAQSSGYVYGVYAESQAGASGAGLHAANSGSGDYAPDVELAGGSNGNGVLASDQGIGQSSSNLVLLSNDDILLFLDADSGSEISSFEIRNRDNHTTAGSTIFSVSDSGDTAAEGTVTGENGFATGSTSGDGLFVEQAGAHGSSGVDGASNGVEISSASNDGLMVGANGGDGVDIWNAAQNGLYVRNAGQHGLYIGSSAQNGIDIDNVGAYGIHVADAGADNYFAGDVGIGTSSPSNRLEVRESACCAAAPSNHVVQIYNTSTGGSADVLNLRINEDDSTIDAFNHFITFHDADAAVALGAVRGNGSGGVSYHSTGSDYAEYLPRLYPAERIRPGDVVGVYAGRVSKRTAGADQVMVASTGAIVAGNDPGDAELDDYSLIAFVGQVQVRVRGPVANGDLLIPSGLGDGVAVAVAPAEIAIEQLAQVIGQAWESNPDSGLKEVRTLVGLVQPSAFIAALQNVDARLDALERALNAPAPAGDGQ
ncbi:MAG: hypothetical protein R3300_05265 [Candidatus Promineifilaceae bacterium]|nr:hypothetical protein [Candidatus Promineifilaceae bacterium]